MIEAAAGNRTRPWGPRGFPEPHGRSKGATMHPVPHQLRVEVQEVPHTVPGEVQVGEELRLVRRMNLLDGLDLHDGRVVDDEVDPEVPLELPAPVGGLDGDLRVRGNAAMREFVHEGLLVERFEQPGAKVPVDRDGGTDDLAPDSVHLAWDRLQFPFPFVSGRHACMLVPATVNVLRDAHASALLVPPSASDLAPCSPWFGSPEVAV